MNKDLKDTARRPKLLSWYVLATLIQTSSPVQQDVLTKDLTFELIFLAREDALVSSLQINPKDTSTYRIFRIGSAKPLEMPSYQLKVLRWPF